MRNFDDEVSKVWNRAERDYATRQRKVRGLRALTVGGCLVYGAVVLLVIAGVLYTAIHFIHKSW